MYFTVFSFDIASWFSPGTPASSTTKTGRHDIAEILPKVALNTINQIIKYVQHTSQKHSETFYTTAKHLNSLSWHWASKGIAMVRNIVLDVALWCYLWFWR
jgi:hypothetical protein